MDNKDQALVEAISGLTTLKIHKSKWVREVAKKTLDRMDKLGIETDKLFQEYHDEYNLERKT